MTKAIALHAYWSFRQKLNRVSSVQFSSVTSLCTRPKTATISFSGIDFWRLCEVQSVQKLASPNFLFRAAFVKRPTH